MSNPLIKALSQRVLFFDGATGTQYQAAGLGDKSFTLASQSNYSDAVNAAADRLDGKLLDGCNEILCLTEPELVEKIHLDYLDAGSDLIETNSFGSTDIVLAEYEIPELVYDLSLAAARIAKSAAVQRSTPDKPRFAIGALGPGTRLISLGQATFDGLVSTYQTGFEAMLTAEVDGLLLETLQDLLMVKAGVVAANNAMKTTGRQVPIIVQVTMEQTGTMLVGSEIAAAINMLECFPSVVAIGMNCATEPVEMAPHVRFLSENSTRPISIQPNAGLPMMEKGQAVYKLTPSELADHHQQFVEEFGVAICGGCCGTTPEHIKQVAERIGNRPHGNIAHWQKSRSVFPGFDFSHKNKEQNQAIALKGCSSLYQFVPYQQDNSFLIIGERTNANGSRAFKEMLASENWEAMTELARELEAEGSHVIDVCTAYVGRNETKDMTTLLSYYNRHIQAPIMIDSTEVPVIEAALKTLAGKPIINSINFEDGEDRTRKVLELCNKYGAAVVGLTINEQGMAKTRDEKVEVANRILKFTREYGLPDFDVFIDCLTFTLGSGDEEFRDSAIETIEAIREIKSQNPLVNMCLGVSNVSFGLKPAARVILNSAFLSYAQEAGLNSAIVHFSKILPESRIDPEVWKIATDLVFNKREFAPA